jgi:outer membrane lipoprotein SlyB
MKKYITTFIMMAMMAVSIPALAGTASAQTRRYSGNNTRYSRTYNNTRNYDNNGQSVYDRHRKAINLGVGTGIGAIIGALVGGKKGALIGAAAGVAGGAIITAKQSPRNYTRYRY